MKTGTPTKQETADEKLMQRVMSYRALHDSRFGNERLDMYAFLSLFHPNMSHHEKLELVNDLPR